MNLLQARCLWVIIFTSISFSTFAQIDLGVTEIIKPANHGWIKPGLFNNIKIVVKNQGQEIPKFTPIPILVKVDTFEFQFITYWPDTIMVTNQQDTVSFVIQIPDIVPPGLFSLCVATNVIADSNRLNDTMCHSIKIVKPFPDLSVEGILIEKFENKGVWQFFTLSIPISNNGEDTLNGELVNFSIEFDHNLIGISSKFVYNFMPSSTDTLRYSDSILISEMNMISGICAIIEWEPDIDPSNDFLCDTFNITSIKKKKYPPHDAIQIYPNPLGRNEVLYLNSHIVDTLMGEIYLLSGKQISPFFYITEGRNELPVDLNNNNVKSDLIILHLWTDGFSRYYKVQVR